MANAVAQLLGYVLSFLGFVGLIVTACMSEWKSSSAAYEDTEIIEMHIGLWTRCTRGITGVVSCNSLSSFLHQTRELQVVIALVIVSLLLSGCAAIVTLFGLSCTRCMEEHERVKGRLALAGGVLFSMAGLLAFGVICWYAHGITESFYESQSRSSRFVFGRALFVGWGAALLCVLGGALLSCCSTSPVPFSRTSINPPILPKAGAEYV